MELSSFQCDTQSVNLFLNSDSTLLSLIRDIFTYTWQGNNSVLSNVIVFCFTV